VFLNFIFKENKITIQNIAKEVLQKYHNGIKIWQLQEEAKYFNVDSNLLLKEICLICKQEEE